MGIDNKNKALNEIIKDMAKDLGIYAYKGENINQYRARAIYSAMSIWIRISTLDEETFESESKGKSKKYIFNKCNRILDSLLIISPLEIKNWFCAKEKKSIVLIRERLENARELLNNGYRDNLSLPEYKECNINDYLVIKKGFNNENITEMCGIAILGNKTNISLECNNLYKFYEIENKFISELNGKDLKKCYWTSVDDDYIKFRLSDRLPQRVMNMIFLLAWPLSSIEDQTNFIIKKCLWKFVSNLINHVSVKLVEVEY